jgi:hypothetical protein
MITITHTHQDGTLVDGTDKGDGSAAILKACRFRWFPSIKVWGIAQSRDHLAKRWQIEDAAKQLRAAGFEVTVEIDDTPREVVQVKADRAERLDDRYDRLTAKAERGSAEAERRFATADHYSERFAGGQPILVGHHSERGARVAQKRIDQNMRAGCEAVRDAERAAQAASVVGAADAYRERPAVIIRRIAKTEADLRKVGHDINGTRPANDWRGAYAPELGHKPASGAWLEQCEARKTFLEHQLAADKAALAEHEANGYVIHSRETIHKGDFIAYWGSRRSEVVRVNAKTVSLKTQYTWTDKVSYEEIKAIECPHEGTVTKAAPAKPLPKRGKPAVTVPEVPAERPEPLLIDARREFFPTPDAVVQRMIRMAGYPGEGMTVLEPSAGLGAIARPVAALGASVDCIEIDRQLADRMRTAGFEVRCGDFLETEPVPAYDRVIMNPPFAHGVDAKHVLHALKFLRPGGLLVSVMAGSIPSRSGKDADRIRELAGTEGGLIELLPGGSFTESGTAVSAVIVVIPVPAVQASAA